MKYFKSNGHYMVVLDKGEHLFQELANFVRETGIETAWIQGLGAVDNLELGCYDLKLRDYLWRNYKGLREITTLQGNVVRGEGGLPLVHIHGTFSGDDYNTFGGHVKELRVGVTCELLITPFNNAEITRHIDQATGANLLCSVA